MIFEIGSKVTFDNYKIEIFESEMNFDSNDAIRIYQQLVLTFINQVGIVKEYNENLTTVSFNEEWDLPIPTKFLVLFPDLN